MVPYCEEPVNARYQELLLDLNRSLLCHGPAWPNKFDGFLPVSHKVEEMSEDHLALVQTMAAHQPPTQAKVDLFAYARCLPKFPEDTMVIKGSCSIDSLRQQAGQLLLYTVEAKRTPTGVPDPSAAPMRVEKLNIDMKLVDSLKMFSDNLVSFKAFLSDTPPNLDEASKAALKARMQHNVWWAPV